ncbi:hypothetical protein Hanom_Chr09g00825621 [Helianthus anomalus]
MAQIMVNSTMRSIMIKHGKMGGSGQAGWRVKTGSDQNGLGSEQVDIGYKSEKGLFHSATLIRSS